MVSAFGDHPADIRAEIGGQIFVLRLTLGGLAAISSRLKASGPAALAALFRKLSANQAKAILSIVAAADNRSGAIKLSKGEIALIMPYLSELFERALQPLLAEADQPADMAAGAEKNRPARSMPSGLSGPSGLSAPSWPFASWMRLAAKQMGLSPNEFWETRLHDWWWLTGQSPAPTGIDRAGLADLQEQYPDKRPADKKE